MRGGGIPGAVSVEFQQVVHRLPEILAAEFLQKCDGVPARAVGVPLPGPAVLDAEAVHLPGGVIPAAYPADAVAQVFQQVRQVCPLGSLHLLVREFPEILWVWGSSRSSHLLWRKRKEAPRASRSWDALGASHLLFGCRGLTRPATRPTRRGCPPPGAGRCRPPTRPHRG